MKTKTINTLKRAAIKVIEAVATILVASYIIGVIVIAVIEQF